MVEWTKIKNFPGYEVSVEGKVRNAKTQRILSQNIHPETGFRWVALRRDGKQFSRSVHRLVAQTYLPPPAPGSVPVHLNGDRDNNSMWNLEYRPLSFARLISGEVKRGVPSDTRSVATVDGTFVFPNAWEAAQHLGTAETHILLAASSEGRIRCKGYRWVFDD